MKSLKIQIEVSPELYNKNPDSTDLGKSIISKSIEMIDDIGFESFTFKKLGNEIQSPESSIYRYFTNKHALLLYLTNWYWAWKEYELVFATLNLTSPKEKLKKAIALITQPTEQDHSISHVNEVRLCKIIFSESIKAYYTKNVDAQNKKGCFHAYKDVVQRVSEMVMEVNPEFPFPHMLISTVIEGSHHQKYFSEHLPALTDCSSEKDVITQFYTDMVFKTIDN